MPTSVRAARPDEADALTELAMRSKAHWGYSAEFMERCRPLLTVTPDYIRANTVFVAEDDGTVQGLCALKETAGMLELDLMFVDPPRIGSGVGSVLLGHAMEAAASTPHDVLHVESDPEAAEFYLLQGATIAGRRGSTVEADRCLPLLEFDLVRWREAGG
jgi:N-acetylglutamate synthase-like GNAT family acetyltransferase